MLELMIGPRNPWTVFDELESIQENMNRLLAGPDAGGAELAGHPAPIVQAGLHELEYFLHGHHVAFHAGNLL